MKYRFDATESTLKDVEIFNAAGQLQSFLYAPEGADPSQLQDIKRYMESQGYSVLTDIETRDDGSKGRDMLWIRGFSSAEQLIGQLYEQNAISGNYGVEITAREISENKTFGQLIEDNALTVSGILYVIADSFVIASGAMRGDMAEVMNGICWWIPSFFLMAAGHQDPKIVEGFLQRDFMEQLQENGIEIPPETLEALKQGAAGRGTWDKLMELVYQHGPIMNNFMQVLGGVSMMGAGINQSNSAKFTQGALVATGMGLGMILNDPEEPKIKHSNLGIGTVINPQHTANISGIDPVTGQSQEGAIITPKISGGLFGGMTPLEISGKMASLNNFFGLAGSTNEIRSYFGGSDDGIGKGWRGQTLVKDKSGNLGDIHNKHYYDNQIKDAEPAFRQAEAAFNDFKRDHGNIATLEKPEREQYNQLLSDYKSTKAPIDEAKKVETSAKASFCNLTASCIYLAANYFYSKSKKENHADLDSIGGINAMFTVAANVIASHAPEDREALTNSMAAMLYDNKYINHNINEIRDILHTKLEALDNSPWVQSQPKLSVQPVQQLQSISPVHPEMQGVSPEEKLLTMPESRIVEAQKQSLERMFAEQSPALAGVTMH